MKITISSGKPKDARDVTVEDGGETLASFKAKDLADAHKLLKRGRESGWDSLKPAKAK